MSVGQDGFMEDCRQGIYGELHGHFITYVPFLMDSRSLTP